MILCVDLDDTLASSGKTINEHAIKFDKDILKRTTKIKKIDNCVDYYYFAKMLNWDRNDLINFFEQCYPKYLNDINMYKYELKDAINICKKAYSDRVILIVGSFYVYKTVCEVLKND